MSNTRQSALQKSNIERTHMSDSSTADGASSRLTSVDLMLDIEEMRTAILGLGTAMRVHSTEVEQSAKTMMDPHDIRLAWRQANAMTGQAVAQLSAAFNRMHSRRRWLLTVVDAANPPVMEPTTI